MSMFRIKSSIIAALALLLLAPAHGFAGEGMKKLKSFYQDVRSLRAHFYQQLRDRKGDVVQESSGTVVLRRPDKFRWDYVKPYPQLIVGDGKNVWIHDTELEQVTIKPMKNAVGNAPAMVLSGKRPLEKDFFIREVGRKNGLLWLELKPKKEGSDFKLVRLGFGKNLRQLVMVDNFDQVTTIRLDKVYINPRLKDKLFVFVMPKGVDVIGKPSK